MESESKEKDNEIQQLHNEVERLSYQVKYLNKNANASQHHLHRKKVCVSV